MQRGDEKGKASEKKTNCMELKEMIFISWNKGRYRRIITLKERTKENFLRSSVDTAAAAAAAAVTRHHRAARNG